MTAQIIRGNALHLPLADGSVDLICTEWRCNDPGERARAMQVDKPAVQVEGQAALFEVGAT